MLKNISNHPAVVRLRNLPPQERMLLLGVGAVILLMLYMVLWLPLQRELSRLRVSVPQEKIQIAQMQVQAMQINQLRASGHTAMSGGTLLANLEQSATVSGIRQRISRMEPDGANGARLTLDAVNFNALVTWLSNLQNQGGVRVEKATLEAQPTAGTVNARIVLRGSGK